MYCIALLKLSGGGGGRDGYGIPYFGMMAILVMVRPATFECIVVLSFRKVSVKKFDFIWPRFIRW